MKGIKTLVLKRPVTVLFLGVFLCASARSSADDKVTRVYMLKNADISDISRVINIAVRDVDKTRVIGGQGKRLVISDAPDQQDVIAQLLPVIDIPTNETDHDKIQMKMLMNAAQYLRRQKIALKSGAPAPAPSAAAPAAGSAASASAGGAHSYDKFDPAKPYKSIYASDDAKLLQGPRIITEEPKLQSVASLQLKGIFKSASGARMALLEFEGTHYTAHDGGLFEGSKVRVKEVTSQVLKDRVILIGRDKVPHEIKFRSSL